MIALIQPCRGKEEAYGFLTVAPVTNRPHSITLLSPWRPPCVKFRIGKRRLASTRICSVLDGEENASPDDERILQDLRNDGKPPQILALLKLSQMMPNDALRLIQESGVYQSKYRKTRITVLNALGKFRIHSEIPTLISVLLDDEDHSIRAAAAGALGILLTPADNNSDAVKTTTGDINLEIDMEDVQRQDKAYSYALLSLRNAAQNDEHFIVRYSAIVALGNGRDIAAIPLLILILTNREAAALEAASAIDALGEILATDNVSQDCLEHVITRSKDPEDLIRAAVVRTLAKWRTNAVADQTLRQMHYGEIHHYRSPLVLHLLQHTLSSDNFSGT